MMKKTLFTPLKPTELGGMSLQSSNDQIPIPITYAQFDLLGE